jgi:hypothetical protein
LIFAEKRERASERKKCGKKISREIALKEILALHLALVSGQR